MSTETPQAAAVAWVDTVVGRGDLAAAWPATDPTLRLVLAQDWVWNHRHEPGLGHDQDWDLIARGLAACPPASPFWDRFAADVVSLWQRTWRGFNTHTWAVLDRPEVLDLDLEVVTFVETGGEPPPIHPGHSVFSRRFALRHTDDGWVVAGVNGEQLFRPGWPPSLSDRA